MNAKLTIENITPKRAGEMLQNIFENQRHVRDHYVKRLAETIRNGSWKLGPDCIVVIKGKLANGQHRLQAVALSGKSCPFIIMETNDDDLYKVMDCGIKRTIGDVFIGNLHANQIASIGALSVRYDKKMLTPFGSNATASRDMVVDYIEQHKNTIIEQLQFLFPIYKKHPILLMSVSGTAYHLGCRFNPAKAKSFMEALFEGTERNSSAWDMRERAIKNSASKAKISQSHMLSLVIKSMKSYFQGSRPGVLRMGEDEEFPRFE